MDTAAATPAPRSLAITVAGWLVAAASAVVSVVSFFALLMVLVGGDGARSADLAGFLLVVVAPPATALAGVGLALRWRWAWVYCVLGLSLVLGWQAVELTRPSQPSVTTTISPGGVRNTVYREGAQFSLPLVVLCAGLLGIALTPRVRREFGLAAGGVAPPSGGRETPPRAPAVAPARPAVLPGDVDERPLGVVTPARWTPRETAAMLLYLALIFGVAGWMAWLVISGLDAGRTSFHLVKAGSRVVALRAQEPLLFWAIVGLYAAVGLGAAAFGLWLACHALRSRPRRR